MIQNPRARRYYEKHREKLLAQKREQYWADPEAQRARVRERAGRLLTPERMKGMNSRRKAKVRGAEGRHSLKDWQRLRMRYDGLCAYCHHRSGDTRDHVIPINRGGSDYIGNILPACRTCNSSKQDKLFVEWKEMIPA